jgi:hypothetical protein
MRELKIIYIKQKENERAKGTGMKNKCRLLTSVTFDAFLANTLGYSLFIICMVVVGLVA